MARRAQLSRPQEPSIDEDRSACPDTAFVTGAPGPGAAELSRGGGFVRVR